MKYLTDVEVAAQREAEDRDRADRKALHDVLGHDIPYSQDPTTGLQPPVDSHEAWQRHVPRPIKPAGTLHPYGSGPGTDLAEQRRLDEGERFVPRCTGCLGRLDPKWCGNIADDDRDAR
jgi:hypothetical protein